MRLSTVTTALLWAAASQLAGAQGLPTADQFRQWDAQFQPGLYEFVDFELTGDGQPKPDGVPPRRVCMDRMNTYLLGRGNLVSAPMKSCELVGVKLDARGLAMSHQCGEHPGKKRPIIGTIVISQAAPDTFIATVARQVYAPAGSPPEPLVGTGQAFKRIGDCP